MNVCTFFTYGIHMFDSPKVKTVSMRLYKNACMCPRNVTPIETVRAGQAQIPWTVVRHPLV